MGYKLINHLRLVVYKLFSCSTNIPRGLSAYNPWKLVVYCLNITFTTKRKLSDESNEEMLGKEHTRR